MKPVQHIQPEQPEQQTRTRRGLMAQAARAAVFGTAGGALLAACASGSREAAVSLKVERPTTVTLLLNGNLTGVTTDTQRQQYEEVFRPANPNVTVDFQGSGSSGADHIAKILALSVAGTPPDAFFATVNDMPALAAKNTIRTVDDLVKADSKFKADDWFDVHLGAWRYQGKQRGLPWQGGPNITYFNKELLAEAGVPEPTEATWTYDAWRDAGNKLRRVMGAGETPRWATQVGNWMNWVYAFGGDVLDREMKKCILDSRESLAGVQLMADFIHRDRLAPTPQEAGSATAQRLFMDKRAAIIIMNRQDASAAGFIQPWVGVAQLPKGPAGRFSQSNIDGFAMGNDTKAPAAAWEVMKWRTGDAFRRELLRKGSGGIPALKATASSPEYLNDKLPPEWNRLFIQSLNILKMAPPTPAWTEVVALSGQAMTQVQRGEASPASAVKDLVPRVNALLQSSQPG
jgi:multiple sugar transport system substrate-binding protein